MGAPFTGHSAMGMLDKSFNGWLEGWSAHELARGTTPGQHKASQAAPGTALQISLDARFAATWFCLLPGHQFWPGRPSQLHGNWFVWWPRLSEDTGAGGLTPSVLVLAPTIRTHCVRRWGQRPELLGHQFWPRRTGRWHRPGAPFTGHSAMGPYSKWRVIN